MCSAGGPDDINRRAGPSARASPLVRSLHAAIYNTSAPDQISYLFSNADNNVVVCERQFLDAIRAADPPLVEHLVVIDGEVEGAVPLADLEAARHDDFDFDAA
jgi:long-chain acyl-CoA synthetase